ncbi:2-amino-4-hydroxy-6-hydroxymethyldihydropteridine diphosphokinase [Devosia albogilva]|uniref:2-amino-4-hydroxy-6-hydroxymethyldihydropteridine pyrophosphokinase n=1 Tax=Devosia albogilva TaxID=429726 RepID=A0ABW5QP52_9HYPH
MTHQAWLSLGANLGDPRAQLREAVRRIEAHEQIRVTAQSQLVMTTAWGKTDQPDFCNMAVAVETELQPLPLLEALLAIELEMGRQRIEKWGPRVIDIDIIAYDRLVLQTTRLTLPHPFAHERAFVLEPLAEIAPDVRGWVIEMGKRG